MQEKDKKLTENKLIEKVAGLMFQWLICVDGHGGKTTTTYAKKIIRLVKTNG